MKLALFLPRCTNSSWICCNKTDFPLRRIPVITLIYDGVKIHTVDWDNSALGTAERLNKKLNIKYIENHFVYKKPVYSIILDNKINFFDLKFSNIINYFQKLK